MRVLISKIASILRGIIFSSPIVGFWGPLSLSQKVVEIESDTDFSVYLLRVRHGLAYGPVSELEYKYWCNNTNPKYLILNYII